MDEKEWRKLSLQSVSLLLVVVLCCIVFSGQNVTSYKELVAAQEKDAPITNDTQEKVVEYAQHTTEDEVLSRSGMYMEIPRAQVTTGCAVYLENDYMQSSINLTFEGTKKGTVKSDAIVRMSNAVTSTGDVTKKEPLVKRIKIKDLNDANAYKNVITLSFDMKKQFEPVLFETEKAYYISLLEARKSFEKIVVLDAGHGGMDEGTSSYSGDAQEKKYTLLLAQKLEKKLALQGIKVYMTRTEDIGVTKLARTKLANDLQADLFVSIHCNASDAGDTSAQGLECLYSTNKLGDTSITNKNLAKVVLEELSKSTRQKARGVIRRNGLYILHHAKVPTTIVEVGYMTNKKDLNIIKKESGQQAIVEGIYNGIMKALEECE